MGFFSETIRAALAGRAIGAAPLVLFDLASGPVRFWTGFGDLEASGETWMGTGGLVSIAGLGRAKSGTSSSVTFTMAGVPAGDEDTMALAHRLAVESRTEIAARDAVVYVQMFDVTGDYPTHPLDAPLAVWAGSLDTLTVERSGPSVRSLTLTAESEEWDRRRPRFGLMTDADQQARYPGDRACEFRSTLRFKALRNPW